MSFIYNLLLFIILISSLYEMYGSSKPSKAWFYGVVIVMTLTAGLAYGISPDWIPYWTAFEYISDVGVSGLKEWADLMDMELGYIYLNKLVSSIGLGYASFTLIIASIAMYLKASSIYKYGGLVFLALLMYYVPTYFFEENVHVRQGLANAIMFYSVRFIIERNLKKFLICFVIAFFFHKAVVAFLLAYWIANLKINNMRIVLAVGGSILAYYVGLSAAIDGVMQFMPFGVAETYNDYVDETWEAGVFGDIVKIITVGVILLFNSRVSKVDPLFPIFRNIYLFGVILYFFFGNGIFAARLPSFYTVYIVFVVPRMVLALWQDNTFKNFVYIGFTIYTLLLYVNFYNVWGDKSGFGNYQTIFTQSAIYGFIK